jgi:hypothetical protein
MLLLLFAIGEPSQAECQVDVIYNQRVAYFGYVAKTTMSAIDVGIEGLGR